MTYYIEVDEIIAQHCETWADAVRVAAEWQSQPGRQVAIWDSAGNAYFDWAHG